MKLLVKATSARYRAASLPRNPLDRGSQFVAEELTGIDIRGDASDAPARSRLMLCEDDTVIGPAHAVHADIAKQGRGRYSHWESSLIFSASDSSDPNGNGRVYVAVVPR